IEVDAILAVREEAHHLPPTLAAELDVDELEPVIAEDRIDDLHHLLSNLHSPEIKKWAWGPLFLRPTPAVLGTTRPIRRQPSKFGACRDGPRPSIRRAPRIEERRNGHPDRH